MGKQHPRVAAVAMAMSFACDPVAAQESPGPPTGKPPVQRTDVPSRGPEPPRSPEIVSFDAKFFESFQPTSALDMINRVPGFAYNKGSTDVRGFGGTSGNVLVDGERPASKSIPLDDILRRISVSAVERIELIRGGASGIDMQGQSVVANIIRKAGGSSSLAAELWTKIYDDHEPARVVRLEGSRSKGKLTLEGSLHVRQEKEQNSSGIGSLIRTDSQARRIAGGDFESAWDRSFAQGSAAGSYKFDATTLRMNLGGLYEAQDRRDTADLTDAANNPFLEEIRTDYETSQIEAGADMVHDFNQKLNGRFLVLRTQTRETLASNSVSRSPQLESAERNLRYETIARGTLNAKFTKALSLEAGFEGAINSLDAESRLARGGVRVVLPSANVLVREKRAEAFTTLRTQPLKQLAVEVGLRYEISTISQSGDANQNRTLSFYKPRVLATFNPTSTTQIRGRLERTVGQLNFKDFAATAALDTGSSNAGNPNLMPERAWVYEASIEQRFWKGAAFVAGYTYSKVEDVADFIPINGIDAPGNIGEGVRKELKLSLGTPLAELGLKGMTLRVNGTRRWSRVRDPVTGEFRTISRQRPFEGDFLITREFPAWKSVVTIEGTFGYEERSFRINEIRTESDGAPFKIVWDYTPRPDIALRVQLENFTAKVRARERILYVGPRSAGMIASIERRDAQLAPFFMVRLRKTF